MIQKCKKNFKTANTTNINSLLKISVSRDVGNTVFKLIIVKGTMVQ